MSEKGTTSKRIKLARLRWRAKPMKKLRDAGRIVVIGRGGRGGTHTMLVPLPEDLYDSLKLDIVGNSLQWGVVGLIAFGYRTLIERGEELKVLIGDDLPDDLLE